MSNLRIFLDNNATTLMDQEVIQVMVDLLQLNSPYNASSIHEDGRKARSILENSRQQIASALGFEAHKDDLQIIFTSSGTEANNLVSYSYQNYPMLVGVTEHVSIIEASHPNKISIPVDKNGIICAKTLTKLLKLTPGNKIVSVMLANNETGVIQDIKSLVKIAHEEGAIFHCDASQALTKINIDIKDLDCDLLTISSHKCGGPIGAAALIAKKNLNLKNMIRGGKQEHGLRAGTENIIAIAGFGLAASNYKKKIEQYKKISALRDELEKEIMNFAAKAKIIAQDVLRLPNTSSIRMPNVKSEEQLIKFDLAGVSVSAGSACSSGRIASSYVLKEMGIEEKIANEVIRVSLGLNTTKNEIEHFISLWKEMYNRGNL